MLAKVAKADGTVNAQEAKYISSVFDMILENVDDKKQRRTVYKKIFKSAKESHSSISDLCKHFDMGSVLPEFRLALLRQALALAYIDGEYSETEEKVIYEIVTVFGIDFTTYIKIKKEFDSHKNSRGTNGSNNNKMSMDECYQILKSKKTDSMDTIKKNYRKLIRQYHYDTIASKELPEDMLKYAENMTKKLNVAYAMIKESRGV